MQENKVGSHQYAVCSKNNKRKLQIPVKKLAVRNDSIMFLPTANCQLPTANCQLPTANCQLPAFIALLSMKKLQRYS